MFSLEKSAANNQACPSKKQPTNRFKASFICALLLLLLAASSCGTSDEPENTLNASSSVAGGIRDSKDAAEKAEQNTTEPNNSDTENNGEDASGNTDEADSDSSSTAANNQDREHDTGSNHASSATEAPEASKTIPVTKQELTADPDSDLPARYIDPVNARLNLDETGGGLPLQNVHQYAESQFKSCLAAAGFEYEMSTYVKPLPAELLDYSNDLTMREFSELNGFGMVASSLHQLTPDVLVASLEATIGYPTANEISEEQLAELDEAIYGKGENPGCREKILQDPEFQRLAKLTSPLALLGPEFTVFSQSIAIELEPLNQQWAICMTDRGYPWQTRSEMLTQLYTDASFLITEVKSQPVFKTAMQNLTADGIARMPREVRYQMLEEAGLFASLETIAPLAAVDAQSQLAYEREVALSDIVCYDHKQERDIIEAAGKAFLNQHEDTFAKALDSDN